MKKHCSYWVLIFCAFSACMPVTLPYTPDLFIEYEAGPAAADRGPVEFLRITKKPSDSHLFELTSGKVFSFISKEDGKRRTKEDILLTRVLPEADVKGLVAELNEIGFFELSDKYRDPEILDGDVKRIFIRLGKTEKMVVCVNCSQKRFVRVEKVLKTLLKP